MEEFSATITALKLRTNELDFYLEELAVFKHEVAKVLDTNPSINLTLLKRLYPTLIFPNESTVRHWRKKFANGEAFRSVKSSRHRAKRQPALSSYVYNHQDNEDIFSEAEDKEVLESVTSENEGEMII